LVNRGHWSLFLNSLYLTSPEKKRRESILEALDKKPVPPKAYDLRDTCSKPFF